MIKAIIFDCFGVLISDALEALLVPIRQHDPSLGDAVVEVLHTHNRGLITPEESNRQIASLLGLSYDDYHRAIDNGEVKNDELLAYIKQLRATYKVAVLSNIDGKGLRRRFKELDLEDAFDVVIASGDIGYAKPEPEAYQIAAQRLKVRLGECIFIDDRQHYLDSAEQLGMHAILYRNFADFKIEIEQLLANS